MTIIDEFLFLAFFGNSDHILVTSLISIITCYLLFFFSLVSSLESLDIIILVAKDKKIKYGAT